MSSFESKNDRRKLPEPAMEEARKVERAGISAIGLCAVLSAALLLSAGCAQNLNAMRHKPAIERWEVTPEGTADRIPVGEPLTIADDPAGAQVAIRSAVALEFSSIGFRVGDSPAQPVLAVAFDGCEYGLSLGAAQGEANCRVRIRGKLIHQGNVLFDDVFLGEAVSASAAGAHRMDWSPDLQRALTDALRKLARKVMDGYPLRGAIPDGFEEYTEPPVMAASASVGK